MGEETKERYWDNLDAQFLLRSLARLRTGSVFVNPGDIHDDLEEAANYPMSKAKVGELLKEFCDKSLLSRDEDGQFRVPTVGRLMRFVNPVKGGMMPDIPDEDEPLVDLEECGGALPGLSNAVSNVTELSPESFVGQRVAQCYGPIIHFGSVGQYCHDEELWWVAYDDGDNVQYDRGDLRKARRLYRWLQSNDERKPPSLAETQQLSRERLTDIEGIPLVLKDDKSKTRTCITQPEKKRRVYYAGSGDTPSTIAKRFSVDVRQLIRDNKRRGGYENLRKKTHLDLNSPVVLPLDVYDGAPPRSRKARYLARKLPSAGSKASPHHLQVDSANLRDEEPEIKDAEIKKKDELLQIKDNLVANMEAQIVSKDEEIMRLREEIARKDVALAGGKAILAAKNEKIASLREALDIDTVDLTLEDQEPSNKRSRRENAAKSNLAILSEHNDLAVRVKQERDAASALLTNLRTEKEVVEATLEDVRDDLGISNDTLTKQAVYTDFCQSKFDELAALAMAQGVDQAAIAEIRNRSFGR